MTTRYQQLLLLTTLLAGSLLIGLVTYRPALPITNTQPAKKIVPQVFAYAIAIPRPPMRYQLPPVVPGKKPQQTPLGLKKSRFFDRLIPLIEQQNDLTLQTRTSIQGMKEQLQLGQTLTLTQQLTLQQLAARYRLHVGAVDDLTLIDALLAKIDVLPPSLVLAQAASESAWGESRFAREANNLYGQWCFSTGCGLVPHHRPEGMTHEVTSYPSWQASVSAYFLNINSHPAYQPLRDLRLQRRQQNLAIPGELLATGLEKYSARGTIYIKSLQQIIRVNDLAKLDQF